MSLVVMGASHKTSPISTRERAAVPAGEMPAVLRSLVACEGVNEAAALSTCNRVELFAEADSDRLGAEACRSFFERRLGTAFDPAQFYLFRGTEAVEHVFRVVCSLDSQVLGEAQILGQTKRAFEAAVAAGTCGGLLTELFKRALHLGKRVRSETAIGSDSVSLSTAAIRAAERELGDLRKARVVLVGAGEMARLTAGYLREAGCAELVVTSRTFAHAEALAVESGGRTVPFERRHEAIARADAVFTATGSSEPVVRADVLARELERVRADAGEDGGARRGEPARKLVIVDEAVPRDVESACSELPGVVFFDQESLSSIVDEGLAERLSAVGDVERMASEAVEGFLGWMQERMVDPTIKEMYEKGAITLERELGRACKELGKREGRALTDAEVSVLEAYGNAIVKKMLHGPVVRLRKEAKNPDSYYYTGAARYLFGLDTVPPGTHHHRKRSGGGAEGQLETGRGGAA